MYGPKSPFGVSAKDGHAENFAGGFETWDRAEATGEERKARASAQAAWSASAGVVGAVVVAAAAPAEPAAAVVEVAAGPDAVELPVLRAAAFVSAASPLARSYP
jgi:hypothetical protein